MAVDNKSSYAELIDALLEFNPSELPRPLSGFGEKADLRVEAMFGNRHLRDSLQLKEIRHAPEIVSGICSTFKKIVTSLSARGTALPPRQVYVDHWVPVSSTFGGESSIHSASQVGKYYQQTIYIYSATAASVLLYPAMSRWLSLLQLVNPEPRDNSYVSDGWKLIAVNPASEKSAPYREAFQALDEDNLAVLGGINREFPSLATWMFLPFSETSETYLKNMDAICGSFPYNSHPIQGLPALQSRQPVAVARPDGKSPAWVLPESSKPYGPKRSTRLMARAKIAESSKSPEIVKIPNVNAYRSSFAPAHDFRSIIQQVSRFSLT